MFNFEKIKEDRNEQNGFINQIGFVVTDVKDGYAKGEIALTEMHGNPIGSVHGGVLFSLADTVGGVAATTAGSFCATVNGSINYLNPAIGCKKLIGEARAVKIGRRLAVIEVTITDETERILVCATMTYQYLGDKIPFPYKKENEREE